MLSTNVPEYRESLLNLVGGVNDWCRLVISRGGGDSFFRVGASFVLCMLQSGREEYYYIIPTV